MIRITQRCPSSRIVHNKFQLLMHRDSTAFFVLSTCAMPYSNNSFNQLHQFEITFVNSSHVGNILLFPDWGFHLNLEPKYRNTLSEAQSQSYKCIYAPHVGQCSQVHQSCCCASLRCGNWVLDHTCVSIVFDYMCSERSLVNWHVSLHLR